MEILQVDYISNGDYIPCDLDVIKLDAMQTF